MLLRSLTRNFGIFVTLRCILSLYPSLLRLVRLFVTSPRVVLVLISLHHIGAQFLLLFMPSQVSRGADPGDYVDRLKSQMRDLKAQPPRSTQRQPQVHPDLSSCTHVFVRHDAVRKPLQPPYDGPFVVVGCSAQFFTVNVKEKHVNVSIDRLTAAYIDGSFRTSLSDPLQCLIG